jgi:hypothetical protein
MPHKSKRSRAAYENRIKDGEKTLGFGKNNNEKHIPLYDMVDLNDMYVKT